MTTKCSILFDDNPNKVFFAGQTMYGTVLLTLTKDQPLKGIYVEVSGSAKCRWCEHVQQKRMTYRGGEVYLRARRNFIGSEDGGTVSNVVRGEHMFNFSCALPDSLPTSFEGTFGSIRYKAEVTLNVSMWPDKTFSEGFTVIKSLDLNTVADVRSPVAVHRSKVYNIWCCLPYVKTNPIDVIARISRSGYTSGQSIEVTVDIINNSNQSVKSMTICLLRIVVYCATERGNHHKTEHVRYSETKTIGCRKQCSEQLQAMLKVPAGPPSDANSSMVCRIRYEVEV